MNSANRSSVSVPFIEGQSDVPVVEFTLSDGCTGYAVIDTGSELNLFDCKFVELHDEAFLKEETDDTMNIVGVSPENRIKVENVSTKMKFGDSDFTVNGLITFLQHITDHFQNWRDMDITVGAVLGSGFLTDYSATMDFDKQTMTLSYDISGGV